MTHEEAIRELEANIDLPFGVCVSDEASRIAIESIQKQIPKKPVMRMVEDCEDEYLCCPTCNDVLTDRIPFDNKTFYFHCLNCGQKFDWSDEK